MDNGFKMFCVHCKNIEAVYILTIYENENHVDTILCCSKCLYGIVAMYRIFKIEIRVINGND